MRKRRTGDHIPRLLREADRDPAKGLTAADLGRTFGIAAATYPRWRQRHDPAQVDDARRVRALQAEVDRRKRLVAEWMPDKPMLQDIAPKKW